MSAEPILLDLPSEAGALVVVRAALRAVAEDTRHCRLEPREIDEVQIALQEACTNAIRHAHHGDPKKRFQVEMHRTSDALVVHVRDGGGPFDIDAHRAPPPEALIEGGYGIRIMRSWMDEVSVRREGECNVVTLVRRYRASEGANGAAAR
jgi:serine/threonine-protein kinase RsbW